MRYASSVGGNAGTEGSQPLATRRPALNGEAQSRPERRSMRGCVRIQLQFLVCESENGRWTNVR